MIRTLRLRLATFKRTFLEAIYRWTTWSPTARSHGDR
jgi:hypothetical protein